MSKQNLELGKEYPQPDEDYHIFQSIKKFQNVLLRKYRKTKMLRTFHTKMHGLVRAEFMIAQDLPHALRNGLFKEEKSYQAWIRFSNAKPKITPDIKKIGRGMAIKVMGVEGEKLLEEYKDSKTQDFVMFTEHILSARSVKTITKALVAIAKGPLALLWFSLHPRHWYAVKIALSVGAQSSSPLEEEYFSASPYRYGSPEKAVRFKVVPHIDSHSKIPENPSDNYLRETLSKQLSEKDAYFDYMIQFQEDANRNLIEDSTFEWDTPWIKVATIRIPVQTFNTLRQDEYGDNLSFNPWHGLKEHQPLGGNNRARKKVYKAMSDFRREHNHVTPKEPESFNDFDNLNP